MGNEAYRFLAQIYDDLMEHVDHKQWAGFVMDLVKEQGDAPNNILELGCGTGNITKELLAMGYEVVGVDLSEEMLELAREKTQEFGEKIILIEQDITDMDFDIYEIDCIIACNDTFNYIIDIEALRSALEYLYPRMKKGGQLVFDISSRYKLQHILGDRVFGESFEEFAYLWENFYDDDEHLIEMEINIFSKQNGSYRRDTETHFQRAYTEEDMVELLETVGFQNIKVYADFKMQKPEAQSERIFFSCVK
ncbi:MAG: class I SAM-dependent methyltransferase [Peptostreptococcaceae bacterium]|nr:class I SAM-dependent methyltransferase [Peptostreptococcaceae bacterium]